MLAGMPAAMANDALTVAHRTAARQQAERDHPGSELSLPSGSAINRITAGVKARRDRSRQVSICWPGLHPPGNFDRKKEYSFASAAASPLATLAGLEPLSGNWPQPCGPRTPVNATLSGRSYQAVARPTCIPPVTDKMRDAEQRGVVRALFSIDN